jgi:hypothetical protein
MPIRGEFFQNPGSSAAGSFYDYQIPYALKLTRSPSTSGGTNGSGFNKGGQAYPNTSTCVYWTLSFWMKKTLVTDEIGPIDGGSFYQTICNNIENHGGKGLYWTYSSGASNADVFLYRVNNQVTSTEKFTDRGNWVHICIIVDTTQSTGANRLKLYRNGVQASIDFSSEISQNSNFPLGVNQAHPAHYFGLFLNGHGHTEGNSYGMQAIVAETIIRHSISGDTIDNYGYYKNGIWVPRDPTDSSYINSTFGSEGLWFKYANASSLGTDSSGNGNNLDTVNLSADNQVIDTPTNDGSS